MSATVEGRPLVRYDLIRAHLTASAAFMVISMLAGLSYSFQLHNLYPFGGIEPLSPGRVRLVHTNMAAYGFIANAFIAGLLFGVVEALITALLGSTYTQILTFALVIVALAIRPDGLFGRAEVKKV